MAWSAELVSTALSSISTEQFFAFAGNSYQSLNPGEHVAIQVDVDFPSSPTDDAVVAVYPSVDGGATYANTPAVEFTVDRALDPNRAPYLFTGYPGYRVGIRRSGVTTVFTSATLRLKKSGVNLS